MGELLNLVGLSTGIVLYGMLLAMVVRAPRKLTPRGRFDRLPLTTAILGVAWNVCALPIYELPIVGIRHPVPLLSVVGFSALGFLPAVVVHSVLRTGTDGIRGAIRRGLTTAAYAASTLAAALHVGALWSGHEVPAISAMRLLTYVFMALVLPVAFVARHQPGARRALWIAALATFTVSALHLTQLHTSEDPWTVELLGHHASLPLALAILYQDYPFALADLFLKRALTLLALVAAAFLTIALLGLPFRNGESLVIVGPREVSLVVTLWVITALLYPRLHRGVSWFVDTIVLRRPDYRSLRATIARCAQTHDTVGPLLDNVCELLGPTLASSSVSWREAASGPEIDGAGIGSIVDATDGLISVVIPTSDSPQYVMVSSPLTGGRRLLSDDLSLLESVAIIVARRIDAVRLMHERYERELREQEIAKLATEAELRALRSQINPHFLFNALTTIGYLIQTAPVRAVDTLLRLTTLLRSVLRSEGEFTTLGTEIDLVEAYLDIERARFEDRLRTRIDVPAPLRSARVPPLLLQPLVENAVKHGIAPQRLGGQVTVTAKLDRSAGGEDELVLSVHDTGTGTTDAALQRGRLRGVGLTNVERRLACQYDDDASLDIRTSPGYGTIVEIRLPAPVWIEGVAANVEGLT
jgi:two-component system LytT family sensor kinase